MRNLFRLAAYYIVSSGWKALEIFVMVRFMVLVLSNKIYQELIISSTLLHGPQLVVGTERYTLEQTLFWLAGMATVAFPLLIWFWVFQPFVEQLLLGLSEWVANALQVFELVFAMAWSKK